MSQTWNFPMASSDSISSSRTVINDGVEALRTLHSGTSAPSSTVAYMLWADTTNTLLKMRDSGDSSWVTLGTLAANLGLLRIDGSNAMTGDLDLDGQALILDTDGDSSLVETSDDVIAMKVGTVPTTVMEWDGTLATPMVTVRGGRLGIDADNDTYIDGGTDDVYSFVAGGSARAYIGSYGVRSVTGVAVGGDPGGTASYFTLTDTISTDTGGPAVSHLSNAPTGGTTATPKWWQCYNGTATAWVEVQEIT